MFSYYFASNAVVLKPGLRKLNQKKYHFMPKIANLIIEMHLTLFVIMLLSAAVLGFIIAKRKQVSLNKRILDVEEEMLHANKEVLRYAEENKQLAEALEKAKIPIPSITKHKEEEEKLRSIPLGKIG